MKKIIFNYLVLLLLLISVFSLFGAIPISDSSLNTKSFYALDSSSTENLPDNYRDIPLLNISGSAQFTPSQINNLKNKINKSDICIVDLRQETHGFTNDLAVSYWNIYKILNNGLSTEEVVKKEKNDLNKIKLNKETKIFHKTGVLYEPTTITSVCTEEKIVTENEMKYKRLAVVDNGIPTPTVVDDFVNFIVNKPENLHLHFHCDAGEGRTTTFMAMYQIMVSPNLSLEQVLSYQYNIGGIILTNNRTRKNFLEEFFNYVYHNRESNYDMKYSDWLKEQ